MRPIILLVLILVGCAPSPIELGPEMRTVDGNRMPIVGDELDYAHPGVVRIDRRGDRMEGHCAGTLISSQHVLTVRHCFYEVDRWKRSLWDVPIALEDLEVWIYFPEPDERSIDPDSGPVAYRIAVLSEPETARIDEQDSLVVAVLEQPVQHVPTHAFAAGDRVEQGETIVAVGYENGTAESGARRRAEGVVSTLALGRFLVDPVLTHPGDSGSPAFAEILDEFEESQEVVVGVLFAAGQRSEYFETAGWSVFLAEALNTIPEPANIESIPFMCEEGFCGQGDGNAPESPFGCSVAARPAQGDWLMFLLILLIALGSRGGRTPVPSEAKTCPKCTAAEPIDGPDWLTRKTED